jgi:ADP-dependent NAD(P)H-hydrate dehydratase / NAD(P)H-hydrate epimerase
LKIPTAPQIREADRRTIEEEKISSLALMERAAEAFVRAFVKVYGRQRPVYIICGTGNNGGDGMAIGRLLLSRQFKVEAYLVGDRKKGSEDFKDNAAKLERLQPLHQLRKGKDFPALPDGVILIDALFGSGLSRPVEGYRAEIIEAMNRSGAEVVAVDVPSGMYLDRSLEQGAAVVCADLAISFQLPKLAFLLPDSGRHLQGWMLVDIGLSKNFLQQLDTPYFFTDADTIRALYRKRSKWSHKGDFGKILLVAGSKGKIGAVVLCTRACLRAGSGLLTVYAPACAYEILQTSAPEAMTLLDGDETQISQAPDLSGFTVLGVGPGMGTSEKTYVAFKALLEAAKVPLVLDADALNLLARHQELLDLLPADTILTPHPKEFERLVGSWENSFERLEKQRAFSRQYGVVLVLKGAHTSISAPDGRVFFNSTGNAGMATGGTGDVLTGILAASLGQGYGAFDAAVLGVFLHGLAADLAIEELGIESMIASDLIHYLPKAYKKIAEPGFTLNGRVF